tara:strand:- start:245 stop:547 length:303 start_codon:yes stop_codon:yes gene_type:complete
MNKKDVKKVREILMSEEKTNFTIKGITEFGKKENGEYGSVPKVFRTSFNKSSNQSDAIWSSFNGMNVNKWGPTCVTLYTYDMLGKKAIGKIKYSDVRFIA